MSPLEYEIENIVNAYNTRQISLEEKTYLLQEILEVRAAQECAGNEIIFRRIVELANIALAVA